MMTVVLIKHWSYFDNGLVEEEVESKRKEECQSWRNKQSINDLRRVNSFIFIPISFKFKHLENSGSVEDVRVAHVDARPPVLDEGETHQRWDDCVGPGGGWSPCLHLYWRRRNWKLSIFVIIALTRWPARRDRWQWVARLGSQPCHWKQMQKTQAAFDNCEKQHVKCQPKAISISTFQMFLLNRVDII